MKNLLFSLFTISLLSGCQTYQWPPYKQAQDQEQIEYAREIENQRIAKEEQRRLKGQIETLQMEISRLNQDMDTLRKTMDNRYSDMVKRSEADKKETIERITSQLEKLLAKSAPPPPKAQPAATKASANTSGYEHVVQPGETLFMIAKAYSVPSKIIMDANKITDPSRLSVGQKIFIPDSK